MSFLKSISIAYLATISLISFSTVAQNPPKTSGFTVDLIHRDSAQPLLQRTINSLQRSISRLNHLKARSAETEVVTTKTGEFLMRYSVGTPPVTTVGIADTGSDLTWTQCPPCIRCFKQRLPLFNPNKSSTYRRIPCNSVTCRAIQLGSCSKSKGNCLYSESFGDGSSTEGELATDTVAFGNTASFPNFTLGCGFKNLGLFGVEESGIVGLGAGKYSLVGQLSPRIQGKFSYCLVSMSSEKANASKLHFGTNAVVSGVGVVTTPMVIKTPETFYFLTLQGITVGNRRLEAHDDPVEGNIIIDSGTTLTFVPYGLYEKMEGVLRSMIKLKPVVDPLGALDLCYHAPRGVFDFSEKVVVHFKGADVRLRNENVFIKTNNFTYCLAFKASTDISIYGNVAQMNFLVGYDVQKRTVSFKPTDCSRSS